MGRIQVRLAKVSAALLLASMVVAALTSFSFALVTQLQLQITATTEKRQYYYRQLVNIYGNVSFEGTLVEEGLVGIQVRNPDGETVAFRTVPANTTPSEDWSVEIDSIIPVDMGGSPKDTFSKNSIAYFNVTVKNNRLFGEQHVYLTITHYDSDSSPFFLMPQGLTIPPQKNTTVRLEAPIFEWISPGGAIAHANLYEYGNLPKDGGCPLCPEKSACYTITESSGGAAALFTPKTREFNGTGNFCAKLRLPPDAPLGTYVVSITAYSVWKGFTIMTFSNEYKMLEDIVIDRVIDIYDIVIVAGAYGTKNGDLLWNPEADIESNGKIDIYDVVKVASSYGTSY